MRTLLANKVTAGLTAGLRSVVGLAGRRFLAAALCLAVIGCSATTPTPANPSQAAPTPAPTPAQATATQGSYRLVFELPRTDWHTTDSITGQATLSFLGTGGVDFGASGSGPIAFSFDEVGGNRHEAAGRTADCRGYRVEAGKPVSSPIKKSGGYSADASPSDFNRWFMTDPLVHLPAGDWTITAIAEVSTWPCTFSGDHTLRAALRVHVTA